MKVADAHCDTLTKFQENPFFTENAHWNINKFKKCSGVLQYFAIYTPPELSGDAAFKYAANNIGNFFAKNNEYVIHLEDSIDFVDDKINILISLEGASPIINDINNLYVFYKLGVRAMGLTWNHRNFVGDGVDTNYGLTPFGIDVIKEMERIGMIIDVSHLNIKGFYDVAKNTSKPFIASHSNSMAIHDHKRNLDDDQIVEIINRGGFIGMNFYTNFITDEKENGKKWFLKHIEHVLELGGDDILGMGADFDGIEESPFPDAESYVEIENLLRKDLQLDHLLIEKIMYKNLLDYTLKMI